MMQDLAQKFIEIIGVAQSTLGDDTTCKLLKQCATQKQSHHASKFFIGLDTMIFIAKATGYRDACITNNQDIMLVKLPTEFMTNFVDVAERRLISYCKKSEGNSMALKIIEGKLLKDLSL